MKVALKGLAMVMLVVLNAKGGPQTHVEKIYDMPAGTKCVSIMTAGSDGMLYGTTSTGGTAGMGSIFSFDPSTRVYTTLYSFSGPDGSNPESSVTLDDHGYLYGTTRCGGTANFGTLFGFQSGSLSTLHHFAGTPDGAYPQTAPVFRDEYIYGAAKSGGTGNAYGNAGSAGVFYKVAATGSGYTVFHSLDASDSVYNPAGNFVLGGSNLYIVGGAADLGIGGVLMIDNLDNVRHVASASIHGGWESPAGNIVYLDGTLYGTSVYGTIAGTNTQGGSVYTISTDGTVRIIHAAGFYSFSSGLSDDSSTVILPHARIDAQEGFQPIGGLSDAGNGDLIGANSYGGAYNAGTIFRLDTTLLTSWSQQPFCFKDFYSFDGADNGGSPLAAPVLGQDGNLYGTTTTGGANGAGTIYRVRQNRRPFAPDRVFILNPDNTVTADLKAKSSDPEGDALTVYIPVGVQPPGTVVSSTDDVLTFDPDLLGPFPGLYIIDDGMDIVQGSMVFLTPGATEPGNAPTSYLGTFNNQTQLDSITLSSGTSSSSKKPHLPNLIITGTFSADSSHPFAAQGPIGSTVFILKLSSALKIRLKNLFGLEWLAYLESPQGISTAELTPGGEASTYYTVSLRTADMLHAGYGFMALDSSTSAHLVGYTADGPYSGLAIGDSVLNGAVSGGTVMLAFGSGSALTGTMTLAASGTQTIVYQLAAYPCVPHPPPLPSLDLSRGRRCMFDFMRPNGTTFKASALLDQPNAAISTNGIQFRIDPEAGGIHGWVQEAGDVYKFRGAILQPLNTAAGIASLANPQRGRPPQNLPFTMTVGQ